MVVFDSRECGECSCELGRELASSHGGEMAGGGEILTLTVA